MATTEADDVRVREERLREGLRIVDQYFDDCCRHNPLRLIVAGPQDIQDLFSSVTIHKNVIAGRVIGDYSTTSLHDLGKIVWSVVKESLSGILVDAQHELNSALKTRQAVCGLYAVSQRVAAGGITTLLVEEEYHMRGRINTMSEIPEFSPDVDLMEEMDDAIDVIIEKVLKCNGNIIFMPEGSLDSLGRIVLLPRTSVTER